MARRKRRKNKTKDIDIRKSRDVIMDVKIYDSGVPIFKVRDKAEKVLGDLIIVTQRKLNIPISDAVFKAEIREFEKKLREVFRDG